jgi:hypothetical protein
MDETLKAELDALTNDVMFAFDEVSAALESGEDARQLQAGRHVEEIARRYAELLKRFEGGDRDRVDIKLGRRVTDLRRAAEQLTKRMSGSAAKRAHDAGQVPFLLSREPGRTMVTPNKVERDRPKYRTGGEVDAWCGKCGDVREHRIVALVGDEPKQVICDTCGSKHGFRLTPSRRATASSPSTPAEKARAQSVDREAQKRLDAKMKLQKELADCPEPRPFDPKGRYKAGEIIVHPELGRGKIENVLRSSLLVRFLDGLRPLDLT